MAKTLTNIEYLEGEIVTTRRQLLARASFTLEMNADLRQYWSRLVKAWREVKTLEAVIV